MEPTVLVLTALEDVTADWVVDALNRRGVPVVRVDPADLGTDLHFGAVIGGQVAHWGGRLRTASRELDLGRVAAVYHRRPSPWHQRFAHLPEQARDFATAEARHGLGGLLANLPGARYVNHPAAVTRADFKPAQLQTAAILGFTVPPTLVTNDAEQARKFAAEHGPVVYKTFRGLPPAGGRAGAIWTQRVDPDAFNETIEVTAHLFQAEITPKTADVRVTVVGRRVFAQQITSPTGALDWRNSDWDALDHAPVTVPEVVAEKMFAYLLVFGLVFGCFDFALTGPAHTPDSWTWIECNSNGQWGWLPDAEDITEAFADVLQEEQAR